MLWALFKILRVINLYDFFIYLLITLSLNQSRPFSWLLLLRSEESFLLNFRFTLFPYWRWLLRLWFSINLLCRSGFLSFHVLYEVNEWPRRSATTYLTAEIQLIVFILPCLRLTSLARFATSFLIFFNFNQVFGAPWLDDLGGIASWRVVRLNVLWGV